MITRIAKVTRKGQITLPVQFRRLIGIEEGDSVAIQVDGRTLKVTEIDIASDPARGMLS